MPRSSTDLFQHERNAQTMKRKHCHSLSVRGPHFALLLLPFFTFVFAAIPFAVFSQAGAPSDSVPEETSVAIEGTIKGGGFLFEGSTIRFVNRWGYPTGVTVNGVSWEDVRSPFQLGFTPDYASAAFLKKEGAIDYRLGARETMISLTLHPAIEDFRRRNSDDIPEVPFRVELAMKKMDPDKAAQAAANQLPAERRAATDPPPGQTFTDFPSWIAMMQASASHWDDPTDGTPHPRSQMGSGHDYSYLTMDRVPKGREKVKLTISAVVDKEARFEIIKNKIYYRPFQSDTGLGGSSGYSKITSLEGDYPSRVTVNGKAWPNLRKALELDFTPDLDALNGVSMSSGDISFSCRYSDEPGNWSYSSRLVLEIRNRGPKPSPSEIVLNTTALPNRDVKDPDDFERDPFVLRVVVDDEATFVFGRGEIRYVPGKGKRPTNVSVDGSTWESLRKPFELRKLLANPEIIEMKGRGTAELTRRKPVSNTYQYQPGDDDEFELVIKDVYPSFDFYEIRIDSRKTQPVSDPSASIMRRDPEPKGLATVEVKK